MKSKQSSKTKTVNDWLKAGVFTTILLSVFSSQAGLNYGIKKSVVASGGQTAGGQYVLKSAVGQAITTSSTSTTYQLTAGFYQPNRDLIFINEFESNQ